MKRKEGFFYPFLLLCNILLLGLQLLIMGALGSFFSETVLPLFVLPLMCINLLFFFYWLLRLKWPFFLFVVCVLVAYQEFQLLYQFPNNVIQTEKGLKILTYNVRLFNKYGWKKENELAQKIETFIMQQNPDVICFQEFSQELSPTFKAYPYRYFMASNRKGNHGTCILSKRPFQQTGEIPFKDSKNNGVYVDLEWNNRLTRIYNIHFESFALQQQDSLLSRANLLKFRKHLRQTINKQGDQIAQLNSLYKGMENPYIICTDLNNNAFSNTYALIKGDKKDAFIEAGEGLGTTYWFSFFPLRIDYIFTARALRVLDFNTFSEIDFSDHKPIMATVK